MNEPLGPDALNDLRSLSSPTTKREAAEHLAVHRNTVARWLGRYEGGGLEGLLTSDKRGFEPGQRTVPEPVLGALEARLADPEGFPSYVEVGRWLHEEFGLEVPYKSVYNLVRYHLGAKLKVPRPEPSPTPSRPSA